MPSVPDEMADVPEVVTGAWLNALTVEQRIRFLQSGFAKQLHTWASTHVAYLWFAEKMLFGRSRIRNGSVFFLGIVESLFAVTAAHVFDGYPAAKRKSASTICRICNIDIDLQSRLIDCRRDVDIATFRLRYDELQALSPQKQAIRGDPSNWPPPHPFPGQAVIVSGFPGSLRFWTSWRSVSFGLYTGQLRVNNASDRSITCPFERECWIDPIGRGLPPKGLGLGGISGGPLMMPMERGGAWTLELGGVVVEAPSGGFETIVSTPAHFTRRMARSTMNVVHQFVTRSLLSRMRGVTRCNSPAAFGSARRPGVSPLRRAGDEDQCFFASTADHRWRCRLRPGRGVGWPRGMKQDILMAAFDPHLVADASGNEPQSPICVLASFVASSARWTDFSAAWQAALHEHPKLEYFKMTEAASMRCQFDRRRGWTETKRDEKCCRWSASSGTTWASGYPPGYGTTTTTSTSGAFQLPVRHLGNDSPYVMLVNQLVVATATFGDRHGIVTPPQYVFDVEMGFDREPLTFWPHVKRTLDLSTRSEIAKFVGEAPSFRDEKDYLPLQAADLYAWQIRNHLLRNNRVPNQTIRIPANPVLATLRTVPMINREYPTDEILRMRDFLIEQGKLFAEQNPEVALIGPHSDPKLRRKAFRQARKARKHPPQKGPRKPT